MVTSSFLPQASTLYTTPTELYVFRSTMILGGGMYIICVHYLSALIDREILKGKEYHIKRRIDTLTNLGNRFSFYESFERLDESKSACLMILDIDHFKQVNDQYGHHIGDVVLKQFGMILREVVHDQHIFRIGGEEFAVLLDDCSEQAQTDVASNINSKIADFTFDKDIKITVSIGCRFTDEGWSKENIYKYYKDADDCLYKAKNTGRNKVIYYK
jgi:diguanylate cyclase (GGDEF)-like protein